MNDCNTTPPQRTQDCVGLYRDEMMLVVALQGAKFPDRCVVTNEEVTGPKFHYREKITRQKADQMASYARTAVKFAVKSAGVYAAVMTPVAILALMKTVNLEIGLSKELQDRFRLHKSRAIKIIFGSMLAMFVFPVVAFLLLSSFFDPLPNTAEKIAGITIASVMVLLFILMWIGVIYFAVAARQPIKIRKTDGNFIWFDGAHEDFLKGLPDFQEPGTVVAGNK